MLRIADLKFEVLRCDLVPFRGAPDDPQLYWGFEVECGEREFLGDRWNPKATCDQAFATALGELTSWTDLLPRSVEVEDFPDPEQPEDPGALLYVWSHEPIRACRMTLGSASSGCFQLRWTGRTAVYFNDTYGSDLAFEVEAKARFVGIGSRHSSEVEARRDLSRFLGLSDLYYSRDERGYSHFTPQEQPDQ